MKVKDIFEVKMKYIDHKFRRKPEREYSKGAKLPDTFSWANKRDQLVNPAAHKPSKKKVPSLPKLKFLDDEK
jgi:hypothetical protein